MNAFEILAWNGVLILCITFLVWLMSVRMRNVGIVDIFWGSGFVIVAWASLLMRGAFAWHSWVLVGMVTVWGARLSIHLANRNLGEPEDYRYRSMRERMGHETFWWASLFVVFWLQGAIMWVVALPVQIGIAASPQWSIWNGIALAVWLIGLGFESIGDYQLARFKANPDNKGKVLDRGLWRWTRHPNYFGDFLVWWGIFGWVAISGVGLWTIISPVIMSVLLMRVSGVTLLEKTISSRRPGYEEYVRRTNAFFPGPRKKQPSSM